jgi:glucose-6-phosphate 1-dehydrogenase
MMSPLHRTPGHAPENALTLHAPPGEPCLLVIFGASGDLTRRLLMPGLYNLACDGLLPQRFAILGMAVDALDDSAFRGRLDADLRRFTTRKQFDEEVWDGLRRRLYYVPGRFEEAAAYDRLAQRVSEIDARHGCAGNAVFYTATPPPTFATIAEQVAAAGLAREGAGWRRLIIEKPFGRDLESARALNRSLLRHWREDQIYRIDHYLGKETVQNLLAFRFSNGMFEPLWNRQHIDHIQFTVAESVGVERRGRYYDQAGVLRDMIQNHMFQMLAYLCMEPPAPFSAEAIRNEKAKVLEAVRIMTPAEVLENTVRGQYGRPVKDVEGAGRAYREEPDVNPQSGTETFAALRLFIDNWRWEGVPIYLRSGKYLWRRGTEILVQFKKAPESIYRELPDARPLNHNQLVFHIQPDQAIELRFQAKHPGPRLLLQQVDMRFDYQESFEAARGTGYEVLLYHCMRGEATLFTRNDLVETAWRIAQPILDAWSGSPATGFPNYPAGGWGPKAAYSLIERDGRQWLEVVNRAVLARVPLFKDTGGVFLKDLALTLRAVVHAAGEWIVRQGEVGSDMYFLALGEVEVLDGDVLIATLGEGDFFGELSLLLSEPRAASVRAKTACNLFVLSKPDLLRVLRDHPDFAHAILEAGARRYQRKIDPAQCFDPLLAQHVRREQAAAAPGA